MGGRTAIGGGVIMHPFIFATGMLAQNDKWSEVLFGIGAGDERFPLIVVVVGSLWCYLHGDCVSLCDDQFDPPAAIRSRVEREMIERGMTAEEVATVIEAAPPLEDGTQRWIASWGKQKRGKS